MIQRKAELAIRKNFICSILILLVIVIVDNRTYLFSYLPFHNDYEKVEAYIDYGYSRHFYANVNVVVSEDEIIKAKVKYGIGEGSAFLEEIVVGYSENREPAVVRVRPVVTSGFLLVTIILMVVNISYVRRIHRLLDKEK